MNQAITRLTSIQKERALSQLKSAALFEGLHAGLLDAIVNRISLVTLHDSEVLFSQQAPAEHLFLLSTGQIKLSRSASNGSEKIISLISPNSTFAEAVLFSNKKVYPVSAVSIGDSNVWCIDGTHFLGVLQQSTDTCFAVIRRLSEHLHDQVADIERLTQHTAGSRLVSYLLGNVPNDCKDNYATITLAAPKNVVASRLSIVPATFSRALARLSRKNLLEVRENQIRLLDIKKLREFVEEVEV